MRAKWSTKQVSDRETFPLIRRLCAESNVVGFELVEMLPYRDDGYQTVLNSDRIVRECLVGIAMLVLLRHPPVSVQLCVPQQCGFGGFTAYLSAARPCRRASIWVFGSENPLRATYHI